MVKQRSQWYHTFGAHQRRSPHPLETYEKPSLRECSYFADSQRRRRFEKDGRRHAYFFGVAFFAVAFFAGAFLGLMALATD